MGFFVGVLRAYYLLGGILWGPLGFCGVMKAHLGSVFVSVGGLGRYRMSLIAMIPYILPLSFVQAGDFGLKLWKGSIHI